MAPKYAPIIPTRCHTELVSTYYDWNEVVERYGEQEGRRLIMVGRLVPFEITDENNELVETRYREDSMRVRIIPYGR